MKSYARIENGRVAEIIEPTVYEVDAPEFVPKLIDPRDPESDWTEAPAGWPTFKRGEEVPVELKFTPEIVATLVDISDLSSVSIGDTYANGIFAPYMPPVLSAGEIRARNAAMRDSLLATATARIAPLQDAADLGEATEGEVAAVKRWKKYRVDVNRIDLALPSPDWPDVPS